MSLLHPALLFGMLLAAIPVALHLLLRARPKTQMFPALRLLQQRRRQNQRRMRLRHVWLLLLRMLLIAVLVLIVARPSLPPANYQPTTGEIAALAAILALAVAAYFVTMLLWQRSSTPRHMLLTRRTYLRGLTGVAALLMALLLVGWPYQQRIAAEIKTPAAASISDLPVAAVLICDNSLSMTYQFEGLSRLDTARSIAIQQLENLPSGSQAAVIDVAGELPAILSADLTAVRNRLEALSPQPVVRSLNDQILTAIRFHEDDRRRTLTQQVTVPEERRNDQFVREIYVFTDLARSAWRPDDSQSLQTELAAREWLGIYLIDAGVEQPTNQGVGNLRLSREAVGSGGQVVIDALVHSEGTVPRDAIVEFWQARDSGPPVKRDQANVTLEPGSAAKVQFSTEVDTGLLMQGELRLISSDPLPFDDRAAWSVGVLAPVKVLVVAPERGIAAFWLEALEGLATIGSSYDTRFVTTDALPAEDLSEVDIVCLLNLPRPTSQEWRQLTEFARDGGGVLLCLGARSAFDAGVQRGIDPLAYADETAAELLPMRPKASLVFSPSQQLDFRGSSHSMARRLEEIGALSALGDVDFRRFWRVETTDDEMVLARWTDASGQPALLSREIGRGRCLVFTSSVDSTAWSDWPRNWTFLAIADQWLQFLSRHARSQHNYVVGDPVVLPLDSREPVHNKLLLRQPDLTQRPLETSAISPEVTIAEARTLGNYQLVTAGDSPHLLTGFSVNPVPDESNLERLEASDLDELLGAGRYGLARDPDALTKSVLTGRFGVEVSGLLITLMIVVFVVEQATSTWFYRQDDREGTSESLLAPRSL